MGLASQGGQAAAVAGVVPPKGGGSVRVSKRDGVTGFKCSGCSKWHPFSVYVFGHMNDELVHTCECGAKHSVKKLKVKRIGG